MEAAKVDAHPPSFLNSENSEILFDRDLPDELLVEIFSYFTEPKDLKAVSLTSRKFYDVSSEQLKNLCVHIIIKQIVLLSSGHDWKTNDIESFEMIEAPEANTSSTESLAAEECEFGDFEIIPHPGVSEELTAHNKLLDNQVLRMASRVCSKSYRHFGNVKGAALLLGGGVSIATGTLPVFLYSLLPLLGVAEFCDMEIDMRRQLESALSLVNQAQPLDPEEILEIFKETDPKTCNSWILSGIFNLRDYLINKELQEGLDEETKILLKGYEHQISKKIKNNNKNLIAFHLLQLGLSNPKCIDLSSFKTISFTIIELMAQSCPSLEKITLPNGTESEVIARIKLINPNLKVLAQAAEMEESPEKEAT